MDDSIVVYICKVGVGVSVLTENDEMFVDGDDAWFDK